MPKKAIFLFVLTFILTIGTSTMFSLMCQEKTNFGAITGRVIDEITKKGIEGVPVTINIQDWQTWTDENGYFKFEKVPLEFEYEVRAFVDKEPYCTKTYLQDVRAKKKNIILKDIIAKRGGTIEGTIKHWDGEPATSMSITVHAEADFPGVFGAIPDKNGYFRVSKLPPDVDLRVVAACWNVSQGCTGVVNEGVRVERGKTTKGVDFVLQDKPTEIHGKVTFQDGEPLQAHITFWMNSKETGNLTSDMDGTYSMMILEPGNYRIHVGYGNERMKISGNKEIFMKKGDKIKLDIVISKETVEFIKSEALLDSNIAWDSFMGETNNEIPPLAELIFSLNEAYSEKFRELILDAYLNDVVVKVKSDCLPDSHQDSIRMKMINRLSDASRPIYVVIKGGGKKTRLKVNAARTYIIEVCGASPKFSSYVYLYSSSFENRCGSLAATLFHELLHVVGLGEDESDAFTKGCYSDKAVDPRRDFIN